ncbi:MAG TPA: HAD family hydrolase [Planctomycetota bacterium]|jgi:hypothetical protein|nr:HAD family hydrolase [Planctomycetota bacterium]
MEARPLRIAFWSGPRNVSTALMRSFESRSDAVVVDEPFYAHYLWATGIQHPGREDILASQPTDPKAVIAGLLAPLPHGKSVQFQKQMAHHLIPSVPREWLKDVRHAILLREPASVIASYTKVVEQPTALDLGYPQLTEIYDHALREFRVAPPVVDANDLLADPEGVLKELCAALGLPFETAMLRWEPGRRATDGVWAPHWYANVERSHGFTRFVEKPAVVGPTLEPVLSECESHYRALWKHRIPARKLSS